jgi:Flp pilus assembly protein TadG
MLRRFRTDQRGVAAVEFALLAPVMILLYCGMAELTMAMMAERRASHAAAVVADLVSQSNQMNATQMTDVFRVAKAIMQPFPADGMDMRVTSVKADANAVPKVVWSRGDGMTALTATTTATAVPANLLVAGDSVVMAEMTYTYESPLHYVVPDGMTFKQTFFLKPRKSPEVVWTAG